MAVGGEEEVDYESDPEELKMSLKMRRREASDDEDGDEQESNSRDVSHNSRAGLVDSDGESEGAAAEYDDEEEEDGEEYYDGLEEYEEEEEQVYVEEREIENGKEKVEGANEGIDLIGQTENQGEGEGEGQGEGEGEKKKNEPSAVPTSGAFYMHDDRFRNNAGGRHRRTFGGRKLWESKDEKKWGHDKFEEMDVQERHYEEGRSLSGRSRGRGGGRGRGRGADRGYGRGGRMRGYVGNDYQNAEPKHVRGRGPRRYHPSMKSTSDALPQYKISTKSVDRTTHASSSKFVPSIANQKVEHESAPAKKVASSLSSASPPFYPSGSANKDTTTTTKKEVQAGNHNKNSSSSVMNQKFSMPSSNTLVRGKTAIDSVAMDKLHIDESFSSASTKPLNNTHLPSFASSSLNVDQMPESRSQGRAVAISGSAMSQPPQINNQVNKVSPPTAQAPQQNPIQNCGQASGQASGQLLGQRSIATSQGSPPKAGKGTGQVAGRGSFVYGGGQGMGSGGSMGGGHGDQNLPAFFPVMPFGAQHPGGIPAVGMAFPGYVAQPNGQGNPEMTWLPVLASATGALGTPYCPPYLPVDGTHHSRPIGQASALPGPSIDTNLGKTNNEVKPQQRSEASNDEYSQRQNKPRRYSEMKFSQ